MSALDLETLSEEELKLVEIYRQMPPNEKQIGLTLMTQLLNGNFELTADNKNYSITVKDNAALQIGNHNKQYHNVNTGGE